MANKASIGVLAFLTGVVVGAVGMFTTKKPDKVLGVVFIHDGEDGPQVIHDGEDPDGPQGENSQGDNPEFEDLTPDNSTLIDSLEGIEVSGDAADLLKVRVLDVERAKMLAMWGSKGVNQDEPTKFQRLVDLTTEHLVNIKKNSQHVTDDERRIIDSILEDRVAAGEADAGVLEL